MSESSSSNPSSKMSETSSSGTSLNIGARVFVPTSKAAPPSTPQQQPQYPHQERYFYGNEYQHQPGYAPYTPQRPVHNNPPPYNQRTPIPQYTPSPYRSEPQYGVPPRRSNHPPHTPGHHLPHAHLHPPAHHHAHPHVHTPQHSHLHTPHHSHVHTPQHSVHGVPYHPPAHQTPSGGLTTSAQPFKPPSSSLPPPPPTLSAVPPTVVAAVPAPAPATVAAVTPTTTTTTTPAPVKATETAPEPVKATETVTATVTAAVAAVASTPAPTPEPVVKPTEVIAPTPSAPTPAPTPEPVKATEVEPVAAVPVASTPAPVDVATKTDIEPEDDSETEDEPTDTLSSEKGTYTVDELRKYLRVLTKKHGEEDPAITAVRTKVSGVITDFLKTHVSPVLDESGPSFNNSNYYGNSARSNLRRAGSSFARARSYDSRSHVSKFSVSSADAYKVKRDVAGDEKKLRTVKTILNKISEKLVPKLATQIRELNIDSPELFREVIDLVFEKAVTDSHLSNIYAALCHHLQDLVVPSNGEEGGKDKTFKRMILSVSHENLRNNDFTAVLSNEQFNSLNEEEQLDIHLKRKRYLGAIRFMCELYHYKLLGAKHIFECIDHLLQFKNSDDAIEALCHLFLTIGAPLTAASPTSSGYSVEGPIKDLRERSKDMKSYSARIRYMMMDVCEKYDNVWSKMTVDNSQRSTESIKVDKKGDRYDRHRTQAAEPKSDRDSDRQQRGGKAKKDDRDKESQDKASAASSKASRTASRDADGFTTIDAQKGRSASSASRRKNPPKGKAQLTVAYKPTTHQQQKSKTKVAPTNIFALMNNNDNDEDEDDEDEEVDDEDEDEDEDEEVDEDDIDDTTSLGRIPTDYPEDDYLDEEDDEDDFDQETLMLLEKYYLAIGSLAVEYYENEDVRDIDYCIKVNDVQSEERKNYFARQMFVVLEEKRTDVKKIVSLIPHLPLTKENWKAGFKLTLNQVDDLACDSPDFPSKIGNLLAYLVTSGVFVDADIDWDNVKGLIAPKYFDRIQQSYKNDLAQ